MAFEDINLLPQDIQASEEKSALLRKAVVICILELIVLSGIVVGSFMYRYGVQQQWIVVKTEIDTLSNYISQDNTRILEGKLQVVKGKINVLQDHFQKQEKYADFILGIVNKIPLGIKMVAINQGKSTKDFEFSGQADNIDQVNSFMQELNQWDELGFVSLGELSYDFDRGIVVFTIQLIRRERIF